MTDPVSFDELRLMLTPHRLERIETVVRQRFRTLTVVVEDLRDPHNQAAVLRTAEGLGLLSAHVVDTGVDTFQPNRGVTRDADKWMQVRRYGAMAPCLDELKGAGFAIYAGALDPSAVPLYELDVARPCAFVFGNEHRGVSPEVRSRADKLFMIPMRGFVESFNVSVAAAICLSHAVHQRELNGMTTDLSEAEREKLRDAYERKSLGNRILRAAAAIEAGAADGGRR
jgi:tRNA (guanosine-2'-O-)-methyltransferase